MKIKNLLIMAALHYVVMYFAMYAMIDNLEHLRLNINNVYMAFLMTSPMLIIEILLMGGMYSNKKALYGLLTLSLVAFVVSFLFIRNQTAVANRQFLESMIPHHSGAILMCEKANLTDPDILSLCDQIIESQKEEISEMQTLLNKY